MKRGASDESRGGNKRPAYSNKPSRSPSKTSSSSEDEDEGHLYARIGDVLDNRYEVISVMGKGTFGKVFACNDRKHEDIVAVKVIRSIKRYIESALIEAGILSYVFDRQKESKVDYFVKLYSRFYTSSGHLGLVCEPLGISLYELVKKNNYVGLPLSQVKSISHQLLHAMAFLHSIELIHTDLKLENILFADNDFNEVPQADGTKLLIPVDPKIKIIDFGGATFDHKHKSRIISTRQYRGPEVILECGWSFPSDIWSVGCMIAEIYDGDLLFETHDDLEHFCLMEKFLGLESYPNPMLARSPVRHRFFDKTNRLRYSELSSKSKECVHAMKKIENYFTIQNGDNESGIGDLVRELLRFDPLERITAKNALKMSFFM